MNEIAQPQRQSLRGLLATTLAVGLIGLLAVLLMSEAGTAQTPGGDDEAESTDVSLTRCHGEGLMDTQIQELLLDPGQSVAEYCGTVAGAEGSADEVDPDAGLDYPATCQGEGLMDPMDPAAQHEGPGSIAEFCAPDKGSDSEVYPGGNRPIDQFDY
ncbi:MAG: hypothetical protein R3A46_12320 [Thermomicrobiales bacterium]